MGIQPAWWLVAATTTVLWPFVAPAQSTLSGPATGIGNGNALEEIVVTAQKRSESIDKVGLTITAIGGEALNEQQIKNVSDLANIVPGLVVSTSEFNTPVYSLRGVGYYDTSIGSYPTVSVYVDQVPLPFSVMTSQASLDLQQVEVLKGPQGILFGENSTGGAINYIANKPTENFQAGAEIGFGRFNTVETQDFVSGLLAPTLAARFAVSATKGNDWQYDYIRDDSVGKTAKFAGRLLLDWRPLDTLTVELNLNGWSDNSDPEAQQLIGADPQHGAAAFGNPAFLLQPFAPANDRAADWSPNYLYGRQHQFQTALRADWNFAPDQTLTSLTSYTRYDRHTGVDGDGSYLHDQDTYNIVSVASSVSQELRVANAATNRVRWVVGGNVQHDIANENDLEDYSSSQTLTLFGFGSNGFLANQGIKNTAGFGNLEFDVLPKLTLKAGARYTKSDRHNNSCVRDDGNGLLAAGFDGLSELLTGKPVTPPSPPGSCVLLDEKTFLPGSYQADLNQSNVSWRVGTDFRATDKTLFYLNVAKGYKAGSFPVQGVSTTLAYHPVVQESVLDYEGGFKTRILNDRLALTGAVFYYDYKDKQLLAKIIDPIFGVLPALVNVPKSSVKGVEVALDWVPVQGLHLGLSGDYLDATVDDFTGVNQTGVEANFSGTATPFTPKWQVVQTGEYRWSIAGWNMFMGYTANYRSYTNSSVGGDATTLIDQYTTLDLRAGFEPAGNTKVTFWGKNVTDRYYWTNVVRDNDAIVRFAGMPATFGFTIAHTW